MGRKRRRRNFPKSHAISERGLENYGRGGGSRPFPELQAGVSACGRRAAVVKIGRPWDGLSAGLGRPRAPWADLIAKRDCRRLTHLPAPERPGSALAKFQCGDGALTN